MNVEQFKKLPIMGILRGVDKSAIKPLMETAVAAGLETIEITMNTEDAPELIKEAKKVAGDLLTIGAGTVLSMYSLKAALDAGASFIVMPTLIEDVAAHCVKNDIPVFPGALTPQEVFNAWQAGATMVKIFPSSLFGPRYLRELKGSFNDIQLMAVGGVCPENVEEYFAFGADGVAVGASIFRSNLIESGNFAEIQHNLSAVVGGVKLSTRQ